MKVILNLTIHGDLVQKEYEVSPDNEEFILDVEIIEDFEIATN